MHPPLPKKAGVVIIPVFDVDRARQFYVSLGWRLDADFPVGGGLRVVQVTPPGSPCSIELGDGVASARSLLCDCAVVDVATLADLLREAEKHHARYEASAPKKNHWPVFYAAYVIARRRGKPAEEAAKDAAGSYQGIGRHHRPIDQGRHE